MSIVIDNLLAYRVLYMLVTPFVETQAYKLGIINETGKNLIKPSKFNTTEQKEAYTYLHRLVFNMKRILSKLPGGDNRLKSIIAALYLIKEYHEIKERSFDLMEQRLNLILESNVILAEETIETAKFFEEKCCDIPACKCTDDKEVAEDAPTNSTGAAVSTDRPVVKKADIEKYKLRNISALKFARRK